MKPTFRKKLGKLLLSLTLGALTLGGLGLSVDRALATPTPRFNFLQGDYEMFMARKLGTSTWGDPVSAQAGDTVEFLIYYHNGIQDSTAHNTQIKATLPTGTGTTLVSTASIDSDETSPITDTVVNGNVVGRSGATINVTGTESALTYVNNSAQWLIQDLNDADGDGNRTELIPVPFPSGQTGQNIFDSDGVNIGSVQGCWQFAGFVYFKGILGGGAPGGITEKKVGLSGGPAYDFELTTAPGNYAAYRIYYNNTGTATATNVHVIDTIPDQTTFASGTAYKRVKINNQDVDIQIPDSQIVFTNNNRTLDFTMGDIGPTPDKAFYLVFQVLIDSADQFTPGTTVDLVNTANITSTNGLNLTTNPAIIHVVVPDTPVIDFTLDKLVVNSSIGETTYKEQTVASPGDVLAYEFLITPNQSNRDAQNVMINDILPSHVTYLNGTTKLYYTGNPNGTLLPDTITTTGVNIGTVPFGNANMRIIIFQVKIDTNMPTGTTTLTNTAVLQPGSSSGASWVERRDTATTDVTANRGLLLTKEVKDKTTGNWVETARYEEGDVVNFRIKVFNNGNTLVSNIVLRDTLPQFLEYINGTTFIDGDQQVADTLTTSGLLLTDLPAGGGKTITFQARVLDCPPLGDQTLVNTAKVTATGVSQISDSATVMVLVSAPPIPN